MSRWLGLTWDHPRGYQALRAALTEPGAPRCDLSWDTQPLEGFESAPIAETAERYDLIVLDHPHVGEAIRHQALRPLDEFFSAAELQRWREQSIGASAASYEMDGHVWALPLDGATQVSVRRDPHLPLPTTWREAVELAGEVDAAIPTGGPHPFLTLCGIAVANGAEPGYDGTFLTEEQVGDAVETLRRFTGDRARPFQRNPIALLESMAAGTGPEYCPHVYGYVNYVLAETPLWFGDAPAGRADRRGSVLGGTGIAISRRCRPDAALLDHLRWLMEPDTQSGFLTREAGQPCCRSSWEDEHVNERAHGFYRATRATMAQAWVRPRHDSAIDFQRQCSDDVRRCLYDDHDWRRLAAALNHRYRSSLESTSPGKQHV